MLYEEYLQDPHSMLSPEDLLADKHIRREDLPPNAYYLHDRGYVEMMIGYNPPLFDAVRISPSGIDLYEDADELNLRLPSLPDSQDDATEKAVALLLQLGKEAEDAPVSGLQREWFLRDVTRLWDELRRPSVAWRKHEVDARMAWIRQYFGPGMGEPLPSLRALEALMAETLAKRAPKQSMHDEGDSPNGVHA